MAASDTSHLNNFSQKELEGILMQLCDEEGVKVSPEPDPDPLKTAGKTMGKSVFDKMGLGGFGKALFGGGSKKQEPATPEAPAPRPASDVIKELPQEAKSPFIDTIIQAVTAGGAPDANSVKTPENLLKFFMDNPVLKTAIITAIQQFLQKFLQGGLKGLSL